VGGSFLAENYLRRKGQKNDKEVDAKKHSGLCHDRRDNVGNSVAHDLAGTIGKVI